MVCDDRDEASYHRQNPAGKDARSVAFQPLHPIANEKRLAELKETEPILAQLRGEVVVLREALAALQSEVAALRSAP